MGSVKAFLPDLISSPSTFMKRNTYPDNHLLISSIWLEVLALSILPHKREQDGHTPHTREEALAHNPAGTIDIPVKPTHPPSNNSPWWKNDRRVKKQELQNIKVQLETDV